MLQACALQMAAELSEALSWALDHAEEHGGNPSEVGLQLNWACCRLLTLLVVHSSGVVVLHCMWHDLILPARISVRSRALPWIALEPWGLWLQARAPGADHCAGPLGGRAPVVHGAVGARAGRAPAAAAVQGGGPFARGCAHARALHRHGRRV